MDIIGNVTYEYVRHACTLLAYAPGVKPRFRRVEALCWGGERATHDARTVDGELVAEGEVIVVGDSAEVAADRLTAGPLIDTAQLGALLESAGGVTLLDVRWSLAGPPGRMAYAAGHLPGAVFVDLDTELAGPPGRGGRHPLPDPADFAAAMRRAGVRRDRPVVCYDQRDSTAAARAWWLLRDAGHLDVRVLDGGYEGWRATGQPVESGPGAEPEPGDLQPATGQLRRVDADEAAALARRGVLLDARSAERYRGEVEPVDPVAGHVPGATSAPTAANVGADGRLLPAGLLAERFAALGVSGAGDVEVATYCGSGVTAAHQVLALEVAGIEAALWPGSWSEWVTDPDRPVATGADPG